MMQAVFGALRISNPIGSAVNHPARIGAAFALITMFVSCGGLRLSPLKKTTGYHECYAAADNANTAYTPIEVALNRHGALKSEKIIMESDVGMMEKTARIFVVNNSEVTLVFHLIHPIDFEFKKLGYVIEGDSGALMSGEMHVDYRTTIGEMSEELFDISFPPEKLQRLSEDRNVSIKMDGVVLGLPFGCRDTYRRIANEIRPPG